MIQRRPQTRSRRVDGAATADTVEGRMALLQSLADAGGELGRLAAETLVATREREAATAAGVELLTTAESIAGDPDALLSLVRRFDRARLDPDADPATVRALEVQVDAAKAALRFEALAEREQANDKFLREMTVSMLAEHRLFDGTPDFERVEREMALYIEGQAELAAVESQSDPLNESQVWYDLALVRHREDVAVQVARYEQMNRPGYDEAVVEVLQREQDAYFDQVAAGGVSGGDDGDE